MACSWSSSPRGEIHISSFRSELFNESTLAFLSAQEHLNTSTLDQWSLWYDAPPKYKVGLGHKTVKDRFLLTELHIIDTPHSGRWWMSLKMSLLWCFPGTQYTYYLTYISTRWSKIDVSSENEPFEGPVTWRWWTNPWRWLGRWTPGWRKESDSTEVLKYEIWKYWNTKYKIQNTNTTTNQLLAGGEGVILYQLSKMQNENIQYWQNGTE